MALDEEGRSGTGSNISTAAFFARFTFFLEASFLDFGEDLFTDFRWATATSSQIFAELLFQSLLYKSFD